ncbi:MAG TPA: GNAT family N-acetyltransferase [Colwellia sp.]|nr:GNAT family N-acetyltransferase [Colwellia sp.]|tara:strand:+ start:2195 stop:3022 length:828 start_codon:yes stop_codon:yes gene_type:complete
MKLEDFEIRVIDNKKELVEYFSRIAELFEESFSRPLDKKLWVWLYINNPMGEPIVSLAFHDDKLVGHYAVIPMTLTGGSPIEKSYIAITTMISYKYRRINLYQTLADSTYEVIKKSQMPTLVFGFPNDNAKAGCRKRLQWLVDDNYCIAKVKPTEYVNLIKYLIAEQINNKFTIDFSDESVVSWRTSKISQEWCIDGNLGVKIGDGYNDLMYCKESIVLEDLTDYESINVLLDKSKVGDLLYEEAFNYRFGYRLFNCEPIKRPELFVQMCMSDVF